MTALRRYPRGLRGLGQDTGYNPLNTNLDLPWDYLPTTYYSGTGTTLEMAGVSSTPVTNVNVPGSGNISFAGGQAGGTGGSTNPPAAQPSACVTALGGGSTAQFICGSWLLLLGGAVLLLVVTGKKGRR